MVLEDLAAMVAIAPKLHGDLIGCPTWQKDIERNDGGDSGGK